MAVNVRTRPFPVTWEEVPVIMDIEYVACYILAYNAQILRRLAANGDFPAFKVGGLWRVDKDDLRKWIDEQKQIKQKRQEK